MTKINNLYRKLKQDELLKMFDGDFYQEKEVGDKVYVKKWDGNTSKWNVNTFSKESFRKYKHYEEREKEISHFNSI